MTAKIVTRLLRKPLFLLSSFALLITVIITYSNHFENPFEFDDAHTIVNNTAIRKLDNIPYFFTDSLKSSTLPANQAWRPGLVTLNAIDYAVQHHMDSVAKADSTTFAGKITSTFAPKWWDKLKTGKAGTINPFWFHVSIFGSYLLLGFLIFFFLLHFIRVSFPQFDFAHWAALLGAGLFTLHTANAETINYIISRDDSFSTMMVVLAFVMYFYSKICRKYFLYIIPVFLGYFVKEPTVMFGPLLLVYVLLFGDPDKKKNRIFWQISFSFVLAGMMYFLSRLMTGEHHTYGGGNAYLYILTQAFVVVHYFISFFLPFNLNADTDWTLVQGITDERFIAGFFIIGCLLFLALKCARKDETKLITFGLLWFFITLLPTSIFPLSEVLNDHRPFFGHVGLTLAVVGGMLYLLKNIKSGEQFTIIKRVVLVCGCVVLCLHAIGTHHRNYVWSSGELLWKDVTEKSPGNGRGWMNYGLALMDRTYLNDAYSQHNLDSAILCFDKALSIYPNYSYAHINMGIALSRQGDAKTAETHYLDAISRDPYNPECYYFYSLFLIKMQRLDEALNTLQQGLKVSPAHEGINNTLASLSNAKTPVMIAQEAVKQDPTPENYVNLSLEFYKINKFMESAMAAKAAATLKPDYGIAWNNICAAYNRIGEWDSAFAAGKKAVELSRADELSKNNFLFAQQQKARFDQLEADAKAKNDFASWVNLGLEWDKAGNYRKFMIAEQQATLLNPNDPLGWNNVCVAANKLGDWDRAIIAGEKAIKLNPDFELAKNNLAEARRGKASSQPGN
ncbi:MAG: tetratricopeptide repeat protein [Bacteroidia bacterium]